VIEGPTTSFVVGKSAATAAQVRSAKKPTVAPTNSALNFRKDNIDFLPAFTVDAILLGRDCLTPAGSMGRLGSAFRNAKKTANCAACVGFATGLMAHANIGTPFEGSIVAAT
jgi:hypothetical protein